MIIILCIPLGLLCLLVAVLCVRARRRKHALVCTLIGLFFLGAAALMAHWTQVLAEEIAKSI